MSAARVVADVPESRRLDAERVFERAKCGRRRFVRADHVAHEERTGELAERVLDLAFLEFGPAVGEDADRDAVGNQRLRDTRARRAAGVHHLGNEVVADFAVTRGEFFGVSLRGVLRLTVRSRRSARSCRPSVLWRRGTARGSPRSRRASSFPSRRALRRTARRGGRTRRLRVGRRCRACDRSRSRRRTTSCGHQQGARGGDVVDQRAQRRGARARRVPGSAETIASAAPLASM